MWENYYEIERVECVSLKINSKFFGEIGFEKQNLHPNMKEVKEHKIGNSNLKP